MFLFPCTDVQPSVMVLMYLSLRNLDHYPSLLIHRNSRPYTRKGEQYWCGFAFEEELFRFLKKFITNALLSNVPRADVSSGSQCDDEISEN